MTSGLAYTSDNQAHTVIIFGLAQNILVCSWSLELVTRKTHCLSTPKRAQCNS